MKLNVICKIIIEHVWKVLLFVWTFIFLIFRLTDSVKKMKMMTITSMWHDAEKNPWVGTRRLQGKECQEKIIPYSRTSLRQISIVEHSRDQASMLIHSPIVKYVYIVNHLRFVYNSTLLTMTKVLRLNHTNRHVHKPTSHRVHG